MALKHLIPTPVRACLSTCLTISRKYGHYKTFATGSSLDPQGSPWPWFSYPAIFYLERFDLSGCRVLEFGSGGSTAYWAKKAREVVSIETDRGWYERVLPTMPVNARLLYVEKAQWDRTLEEISTQALFDIVVIDGSFRHRCAQLCTKWVAKTGLVILDNPDWYPQAHVAMAEHDFIEVSFSGVTPISSHTTTTNFYFRRAFSIPFRKSFSFSEIPGSFIDNHEGGDEKLA